jgi:hypothetical protein
VALADPATPVILSDFLRTNSLDDVDMIKIDVDGPDFDILQSLSDSLNRHNVLALGLEVNFVGSADESDNTFCNTDRFMRAHGYNLFHLSVRPYSRAALPSPYLLPYPAQTQSGQPIQGDALYVRDLGASCHPESKQELSPAKLAKAAFIFAAMGLPDCAAELLLTHRERLRALLDVDVLLDLLCEEAQPDRYPRLSYRNYMAAFERDDPMFYPSPYGSSYPLLAEKNSIAFSDSVIFPAGPKPEVHGETVVRRNNSFLDVITPRPMWNYALSFDLAGLRAQREDKGGDVGFAAEVEINVSQGQVGIMVVGQDNSTPQSAEAMIQATTQSRAVIITIPPENDGRRLVFRNTARDGHSKFRLLGAKLRFPAA